MILMDQTFNWVFGIWVFFVGGEWVGYILLACPQFLTFFHINGAIVIQKT
jgi:hypothetical protein